ncbi:MAG: ABC transporter permease [Spirochaetes bacterium]|nr:MAG: ABC transporter permease [Spirochaetota bacterium]
MIGEIFTVTFITGLIGATLRMSTPIILATLGEIITERSGVLNLGIEGTMLFGAAIGFLTTLATGNLWLGVLMAALAGMLLALLMSVLAVYLGLSQHVSGLGITLFASGLSMFIYRLVVGSPTIPPTVTPFTPVAIPLLSKIPLIGPSFFNQYALTYITWILIPLVSIFLFKTRGGLRVRTVGQNPFAADTVGVNVNLTRTLCVVVGGAFFGVAGAFLTLAQQNMFLMDVIGGRGWIAIAMTIFGNWNPLAGAGGALIFGFLDAFQLRMQSLGVNLPFHVFLMIPYLVTILALIGVSGKASVPAGLLKPYRREEKGG